MVARIYKPARTAMQSGKAKSKEWLLEFVPEVPRVAEPLMGWTAAAETQTQVSLSFESKEQAIAYAERERIPYELAPEPPARPHRKAYADNFKWGRQENWTH
jgi:ETC complex I subunit conserved region